MPLKYRVVFHDDKLIDLDCVNCLIARPYLIELPVIGLDNEHAISPLITLSVPVIGVR